MKNTLEGRKPQEVKSIIDSPETNSREKYFLGEWAISSNPMDPIRVKITVNGETLTWKRGVKTAVPGRYLEAALHTTHPIYSQDPDDYDQKEGYRKTVRELTTYPFSKEKEITESEYLEMKSVGDKEVKDYLRNHGLVRA